MRVTAHCEGGGCADPEFVFADTEAGPDGSYVLYLPNFTQLGVP
jgi:hypothetical protein